uniref:Putative u3 small nucleolar rna-associated protein 4 n=1 Tax=Amblyomma aureolatum TaxID=187763 RepID=A0A1E1XBQ2_9ACAR
MKATPFVEGVVLGDPSNSVEAAVWLKGRLFTTGLHGRIVEYDLATLEQKYSVAVTSGAAWCLAVDHQKTRLAAGTEECVCIYEITEDGLNFCKTLNKLQSRILCLAWSQDGSVIATGTTDAIVTWDVKSGRALDRISVGRLEKNVDTLVWCLALTSDFTIITGDSCGRTSFWDGKTATLISSFKVHSADVLSLCLSEDEKNVFVAGVDPLLVKFTRVSDTQTWAKSMQRTCHALDIRALAFAKGKVLSGGLDASLAVSTETTFVSHAPFQLSPVRLAQSSGRVLLNYGKHLELWQLGSTVENDGPAGVPLRLATRPVQLACIKARSGASFHTVALTHDCRWLACSDTDRATLYRVDVEADGVTPAFTKVSPFMEHLGPARQLLFSPDGNHLVALGHHGAIHVFSMPPSHLHTIPPAPGSTAHAYMTCLSSKGHLAVADNESNIVVYDLKSSEMICRLPQTQYLPIAMRFNPVTCHLLVIYNNNQVVEFSVKRKSYSQWCKDMHKVGGLTLDTKTALTGISFDSKKEGVFFAHSDCELIVIDKAKVLKKGTKSGSAVRRNAEFKWLVMFDQVQDDMIVVEVPPSLILQLQPPLWKKKYGT